MKYNIYDKKRIDCNVRTLFRAVWVRSKTVDVNSCVHSWRVESLSRKEFYYSHCHGERSKTLTLMLLWPIQNNAKKSLKID